MQMFFLCNCIVLYLSLRFTYLLIYLFAVRFQVVLFSIYTFIHMP